MRAKKLNIYEKTLFKSKKVYFDYYFLIYIYIITQTHIISEERNGIYTQSGRYQQKLQA